MLAEGLAGRDLELDDVFGSNVPLPARTFVDAMPMSDAMVSLLTAAHRNPTTSWSGRTIFDIDALSLAVAYCDIVVTERHFGHWLRVEGLAGRLGTQVVTNLHDLLACVSRTDQSSGEQ